MWTVSAGIVLHGVSHCVGGCRSCEATNSLNPGIAASSKGTLVLSRLSSGVLFLHLVNHPLCTACGKYSLPCSYFVDFAGCEIGLEEALVSCLGGAEISWTSSSGSICLIVRIERILMGMWTNIDRVKFASPAKKFFVDAGLQRRSIRIHVSGVRLGTVCTWLI